MPGSFQGQAHSNAALAAKGWKWDMAAQDYKNSANEPVTSPEAVEILGTSANVAALDIDQPSTGSLDYRTVGNVVYQDTPTGWAVADNIGSPFTSAERATAVPTQEQVDAQELRLDTDTNILYRPTGTTAGAYVTVGSDIGPYVDVTVAGTELEVNKRHRVNGIDVLAPSAPALDDWFSVYNQIPLLGGTDSTITGGNFRFITSTAVVPLTAITPGHEAKFVYDGASWLQIDIGELLISMSDADTGETLQKRYIQKIHSPANTSEFFLPPGNPFGVVRIMLSANSDGSFKISQHATTAGSTIAFEDGTLHNDFMVPNSGRGQVVRFYGDGLNWNLVRPYIVKAKGAVVWHTAETDVPIVDAKNIYPLGTNLGLVPEPTHIEGARYWIETGDLATELLEGNAHGYLSNGVVGASGKWIREATAASHILDKITIGLRSGGTNAGSSVDITIADADGNVYPASDFLASGTFDQYAGGTAQIVLDRVPFTGRIGLGRNKEGTLELEHIGALPNGLSAVTIVGNSGGNSNGAISVLYKGTNYNDSWPNKESVETVYWTTVHTAPEASDQAAYWEPNKEYLVGDVLSHTEQDATTPDPNVGELFNWRVTTQINQDEFDTWDGTNYAAIQSRLERFSVGAVEDIGTDMRADSEQQLLGDNIFFFDETVGAEPAVPALGMAGEYRTGVVQSERAAWTGAEPIIWTEYQAVENAGVISWSEATEGNEGGATKFTFHASDRLESLNFTLADRRTQYPNRQVRQGLTVAELSTGNADWTVDSTGNTSGTAVRDAAAAGYTRLKYRHVLGATSGYDYWVDWKLVGGEYTFIVEDDHNAVGGSSWGYNRQGSIVDIVYKYAATDPVKPTWTANTAYTAGDVIIGQAPAGVTETQDTWYVMEAVIDRPNTIATLDATEWNATNWTFTELVPTKQDIVKTFHAALPDPGTLLSGSRVTVVANSPDPSKNGSYTVTGPVGGAGTGYVHNRGDSKLPVEERADVEQQNIDVSNVFYLDDTVGAEPVNPEVGQEYATEILQINRGDTTTPAPITSKLTRYVYVDRGNGVERITTESSGGGVTNSLNYPVGNFIALPVNDGATGEDGAVYWLPTVDALEITMPDKATMDIATGIYRVQISADWAGLAAQTTPLSFIDDTANGLSMGEGFPVEGQEAIDLFMDPAGDRWILTSGDRVTLDQITPSYDEFAEVPLTVRQFLMTGNGAPPEGSYRRQVADNAPQLIG